MPNLEDVLAQLVASLPAGEREEFLTGEPLPMERPTVVGVPLRGSTPDTLFLDSSPLSGRHVGAEIGLTDVREIIKLGPVEAGAATYPLVRVILEPGAKVLWRFDMALAQPPGGRFDIDKHADPTQEHMLEIFING